MNEKLLLLNVINFIVYIVKPLPSPENSSCVESGTTVHMGNNIYVLILFTYCANIINIVKPNWNSNENAQVDAIKRITACE